MKQRNIYENVETEPAVDMSSYLDMEAIIDARLQRLDYENFNNRYKGIRSYKSSGSGSCHLKNYYDFKNDEFIPNTNPVSNRLLALGNSIHDTIQFSYREWFDRNKPEGVDLHIEPRFEDPELMVAGHLDILIIDRINKRIVIRDIKSAGNFTFQKIFGQKKNRDELSAENNKLQIGTYGHMVMQRVVKQKGANDYELMMFLDYYKKETSVMKSIQVPVEYVTKAFEYWQSQLEFTRTINELTGGFITLNDLQMYDDLPKQSWECNYCNFARTCPIPNQL